MSYLLFGLACVLASFQRQVVKGSFGAQVNEGGCWCHLLPAFMIRQRTFSIYIRRFHLKQLSKLITHEGGGAGVNFLIMLCSYLGRWIDS